MAEHDHFFKTMLKDIQVAKAFLQVYLPFDIYKRCDMSTLKPDPAELEAENISAFPPSSQNADIVYELSIDGEMGYIYALIEHQSRVDSLMRFRLLRYQVGILHAHSKKYPDKKLPVVIPLVFYAGKRNAKEWDLELSSCFEEPDLAFNYLFHALIFIDITQTPDEEILKHSQAALFELVQKHVLIDNNRAFAQGLSATLRQNPVSKEMLNDVMNYVLYNKDTEIYQDFLDQLKQVDQRYNGGVMNIAERLKEEGRQRGLQEAQAEISSIAERLKEEGRQRGLQEAQAEGSSIAERLKEEGRQRGLQEAQAEGSSIAERLKEEGRQRGLQEAQAEGSNIAERLKEEGRQRGLQEAQAEGSSIAERLKEEGRQRGLQEGRAEISSIAERLKEEGQKENARFVVKGMLDKEFSLDLISELTHLSLKELKQLQKEFDRSG